MVELVRYMEYYPSREVIAVFRVKDALDEFSERSVTLAPEELGRTLWDETDVVRAARTKFKTTLAITIPERPARVQPNPAPAPVPANPAAGPANP